MSVLEKLLTELRNTGNRDIKLARDGSSTRLSKLRDGVDPDDAVNLSQLTTVDNRLTIIENNEKVITYYEVVSGASSGNSVTVPTNGTILLDKFGTSKDAVLSTIDGNNNPTWESPKNSSGIIVTTSLDVNGNYTFSSTPVDANVAIVYVFKIKESDYNNVDIDFVISEDELLPSLDDFELSNISVSTYSTVQDMQNVVHSAGRISGNTITDNGDGTYDVVGGTGLIRATNDPLDELLFFDWSGVTNQAIADGNIRYIGVEYNGGSPQITAKSSDVWDFNTNFPLGVIVREGSTIHVLENNHNIGNHASVMNQRLYETAPLARDERGGGLILGETGTRNITITAGRIWDRFDVSVFSAIDTSAASTFDAYYKDGIGGLTKIASQSQINNTQYDDGSGTLQSLGSNKYTVRWVYSETDGGVVVVFGSGEYSTLTAAQAETVPSLIPNRTIEMGLLVGRIIVKQGQSAFSSISSAFDVTFTPSVSTDHNELSNLQGGTAGEYYHLTATEYSQLMQRVELINETFESGDFTTNGWTTVNGSETNKWVVGTGAAQAGTYGAYISNSGTTYAYSTGSASVTHFYKDFTFPITAEDPYLSFYFKCEGEAGFDFMNIFIVDTTTTPVAGTPLSTGILLAATGFTDGEFNLQSTYKFIKIWIDPTVVAGQTKRFVFSWENDGSLGTSPGAALDNIQVSYQA